MAIVSSNVVKLSLVECFEVEWCNVVHGSYFLVQFGHRLKSQSSNAIVAHLKKGKSKELKDKTSLSILFSLQTL